jgi:hypothetical protein
MNDGLLHRMGWNPQPLLQPELDPGFTHLNGPQRMVEAICSFVLSAEHWISSDGVLREWLRVMLRIGLIILCPVLAFMPTITFALWQLAVWTAFVVVIAKNLVLIPLTALAAITALGVLVIVIRSSVRALARS